MEGRTAGWLHRGSVVAAVCIGPLFGGCVSAVDETTAFGFGNKNVSTTAIAEAAKTDAAGQVQSEPTRVGSAQNAGTASGDGKTDGNATAAKEDTPAGTAPAQAAAQGRDADAPVATGSAAIAAFAGSTVLASSQTAQPSRGSQNGEAGGTMFASLYAQSQAKTPIRNADAGKTRRVILPREGAPVDVGGPALPGVRTTSSLFEIGQKASADYDADILDEASGEEPEYQTASISGLARLAPNGLMVQRPDVQTSCFGPELVAIIRAVESRFKTKIVVTSGYRSPSHNVRVSGAKRSMHLQCKAADIIVPNADRFQVANFVRTLPNRGGVGTYCHTSAIHVDTGRQRDWNWACRRGPKRGDNLILAAQKGGRVTAKD